MQLTNKPYSARINNINAICKSGILSTLFGKKQNKCALINVIFI